MSESIPWASINALMALEKRYGTSDAAIVNAVMQAYDDELDAWQKEIHNDIMSRTGGHNHVPELVPFYWLATQSAAANTRSEFQGRLMRIVRTARNAPDLWSDERLVNAIADAWDVALAHSRAAVTRNMAVITNFDKSLYSHFIRPYAIMYFFYSASKEIVHAYIFGGMYRVLQTVGMNLPKTSKLAPYVQTGFRVLNSLSGLTEQLSAAVAQVRPTLRKLMLTLLTGPIGIVPTLSPLGSLVGVAGLSFVAGCLLGEAIFKGILPALGVELPKFNEGEKEQLKATIPSPLLAQMELEASEAGKKVSAIVREVSEIEGRFERGEGAPFRDPVERLGELKEQLGDISTTYGVEYLNVVKGATRERIDELVNKITVAQQALGAAVKPDVPDSDLEVHINDFEVFELLYPYIGEAIKEREEQLGHALGRGEVETIISDQAKKHKDELEAYGEKVAQQLVYKDEQDLSPEVSATQVAIEVINDINELARSEADVSLFQSEVDTLRGLLRMLSGERRVMVETVIDEVVDLIARKNAEKDKKTAGSDEQH